MKKLIIFLVGLIILSAISNIGLAQQMDTLMVCATDPGDIIDPGELRNTTWTLKVLFVEFSDIKHRQPSINGKAEYTITDWNNLLFSQWTYLSPQVYGPDQKNVYGSMRDFFSLMSDGEFELAGNILNPDNNQDGVPDWLTVTNTKEYYANHSYSTFVNAAIQEANGAGLNVTTNSTTKLAIIYAGHTYRGKSPNGLLTYNGLNPRAFSNTYLMGERFAPYSPWVYEREDAIFSGIGIHCHEFGHLLGWPDLYNGHWANGGWDLMANGNYNPFFTTGTNNKIATAPAPPSPYLRYSKGWIEYHVITTDISFSADYDLKDPEVFKIADNLNSNRYFLIENRHFEATMNFNGTVNYDYNHWLPWNQFNTKPELLNQGLLVWGRKKYNSDQYYPYLIQADGFNNASHPFNSARKNGPQTGGDSGDPFPGFWGVNVIYPWSFPAYLDIGPSPSTRLSQNVGFEISEIGYDYILVDLYYQNPEDASPAMPRFLEITDAEGHPYLTWEANSEPDLESYYIYRKIEDQSWYNIDNVDAEQTSYLDTDIYLAIGEDPGVFEVSYYIKAYDAQDKFSVPSNTEKIYATEKEKSSKNLSVADLSAPEYFSLANNYPNPFNPITTISFSIPNETQVRLTIYSITGEKITELTNGFLEKGFHTVAWNGTNNNGSPVSTGIYIYELIAGDQRLAKKLFLAK